MDGAWESQFEPRSLGLRNCAKTAKCVLVEENKTGADVEGNTPSMCGRVKVRQQQRRVCTGLTDEGLGTRAGAQLAMH